ncbi:MAG: lamin tail domain-containing protein, partial [Candidatus Paceibacterota bacterium]
MKPHNLLVGMILTVMLICFLAIPQKIFAADFNFFNFGSSEDYQVLSEFESKRIIEEFPGILYKKWFNLSSDGYSEPEERTVISLLKELSTLNLWNYYFRDLPVDVSFAVAKQSVEISKLVATEDVSGVLGKIEKETAKAAVSYLKEYFFKNQIKVSFGAMEVKYKTETGPVDSPFQYIIMYQPISDEKGRVVARMYSPKEIIPPPSRGSLGLAKGFLNSLDSGQNIPPFIVEISGEMRKGMYGSHFWNGDPEIKAIFPEKVPDFGLKPRTWQEKYVINPIKDGLSGILSFGQLLGFQTESIDYLLKEGDTEKIEEEVKDMKEEKSVEESYPEKKEEIEKNNSKENENIIKIIEKKAEEEKKEEIKEEIKIKEKKEEKVVFSSCSKNIPYAPKHSIVFNEVAWMGSKSSANDEWIELKNVSGKDINLKGYTISDKGDQIKIVFDNYFLLAGDFVLLERTDDASVPLKQ